MYALQSSLYILYKYNNVVRLTTECGTMCVQCMYPINRIYLMFINALRKMYINSNDYYSYTWINTAAGEFYTAQYKYIMCARIIILGFFSSAIIRFRS